MIVLKLRNLSTVNYGFVDLREDAHDRGRRLVLAPGELKEVEIEPSTGEFPRVVRVTASFYIDAEAEGEDASISVVVGHVGSSGS